MSNSGLPKSQSLGPILHNFPRNESVRNNVLKIAGNPIFHCTRHGGVSKVQLKGGLKSRSSGFITWSLCFLGLVLRRLGSSLVPHVIVEPQLHHLCVMDDEGLKPRALRGHR